ncbi:MAG: protein-tyrosine phosphatase family protein [Acidobacteriota bacterium]
MRIDWILPGLLAGGPRPGLLEEIEKDYEQLRSAGFRRIVNLTTRPLDPPPESVGMEGLHFPIPDMGAPTPRAARAVVEEVLRSVDAEEPVLLHCKAGLGRTGTLLACCLIEQGASSNDAIDRIRLVNRRFIQSQSQELFLRHYQQHVEQESRSSSQA